MRAILWVAMACLWVLGCAVDEPAPRCELGRSTACVCSSGAVGAQECGAAGAWSPCVCAAPVDAGSDAPDAPADAAAPDAMPAADGSTAVAGGCPAGWGACIAGACVDLASSAAHCGACGMACSPMWRCARGVCTSPSGATCDPGQADCDRNETNGCESALRVDHINCGACDNNCRARGLFCREGVCAS